MQKTGKDSGKEKECVLGAPKHSPDFPRRARAGMVVHRRDVGRNGGVHNRRSGRRVFLVKLYAGFRV
jgi:hypothetical protein